MLVARAPTKDQVRRHEQENHATYAEWCEVCVATKGTGAQHRRRLQTESEEGPVISSDFFYMSTDEGSVPYLAVRFSRSGRIAGTQLENKGVTAYGVKFFSRFIEQTGVKRFINKSDGEHAMVALKQAAARASPGVEAISRESPVGDHQANGAAESAVRSLKSQMRAVRLALEKRLGRSLESDDPVLAWIATFAGDVIARFRKGADGKTPWERETGRKWAGESLEFGERFYLKESRERGTTKRDWEPRLIEARFVGQHARTGAMLGLTADGVIYGRLGRRLPAEERWSLEGWDSLKGLPWDLRPTGRAKPEVVVEAQTGGAERVAASSWMPSGVCAGAAAPRPQQQEPQR